jgi:hypothetical protein
MRASSARPSEVAIPPEVLVVSTGRCYGYDEPSLCSVSGVDGASLGKCSRGTRS